MIRICKVHKHKKRKDKRKHKRHQKEAEQPAPLAAAETEPKPPEQKEESPKAAGAQEKEQEAPKEIPVTKGPETPKKQELKHQRGRPLDLSSRKRLKPDSSEESTSSSTDESESQDEPSEEAYLEDYPSKELYKMLRGLDHKFHGCITDFTLSPQKISNLLSTDRGTTGKFTEGAQVTRGDPVMLTALASLESTTHHMIRAMGKLASKPKIAAEHLVTALPLLMHGISRLHARVIMDAAGISTDERQKESIKDSVPRELRAVVDTAFFQAGAGAVAVPGIQAATPSPAPPSTPVLTSAFTPLAPSPIDTPSAKRAILGLPPPEYDNGGRAGSHGRARRRARVPNFLPPPEPARNRVFPFHMGWHTSTSAVKQREQERAQYDARHKGKRKQSWGYK
jgi:hypothetical protein